MRPIDADELLKSAGIFEAKVTARGCGKSILPLAKTWLWSEVNKAPTIDAVPVVHGEWFSLTNCANAGVYCSVCHKKVWREDYAWCNRKNKLRSNYCPNCGAIMDGE